jgi:tetratricopeptide (TPR) repeat protein
VRITDAHGLRLTTSAEAAASYGLALDRVLALEDGAEAALHEAIELDPRFALAHAVLATLLAEHGAPAPVVRDHLHAARAWAHAISEREASFVTAAVLWCADGLSGDASLLRHVRRWPTDTYAVSLLTPSIASAGVSDGVVEVWPLLDELVVHYADDWWLGSMRAFARAEQRRWGESEDLARAALAARPNAGHAAHALAHVLYETGRHQEAVRWIDGWRTTDGQTQRFRGHFSWHAALCELAEGDMYAVRRRYHAQLEPLVGSRALVDAGSLLARCAAYGVPMPERRAQDVASRAGGDALTPQSPFMAWHVAVLAGLCRDPEALDRTEHHARRRAATVELPDRQRQGWDQVAGVCQGLRAALRRDPTRAAALLSSLGDTAPMGGSPAQRELLDDLAIRALLDAGEKEAAARLCRERLRRRPSDFDRRVVAAGG